MAFWVFTLLFQCAPAALSNEDVAARLAAHAGSQFDSAAPGGIVLVARSGKPVLHEAYGLADVESGRAMQIDEPLPIGSLTKSFTAAAILRLVDSGALSLSDDVRRHYPRAPVGDHKVTIEQLLTHTSGMPNLVDVPGFFEWAQQERRTEDLLALTRDVPFLFEPGASYAYSDSGYILLGAVLEQLGGKNWYEVILDLVAGPLGLQSVAYAGTDGAFSARGYVVEEGGSVQPASPIHWSVPHASGALVANAADLLRWIELWRQHRIASAGLVNKAWAPKTLPNGLVSGYGYGWKRCPFEGQNAIQHGGWVPGFTASLLHVPDEELTAVVLTNADGGVEATYLARQLSRLLLAGRPYPIEYALDDNRRRGLVGRYRSDAGADWQVSTEDEALYLDVGHGPFRTAAVSPTRLCAKDSDGTWCFEFSLDDNGIAESVTMSLTCEPQDRAFRSE